MVVTRKECGESCSPPDPSSAALAGRHLSEESPPWCRSPVAGPPGYPALNRFQPLSPRGPNRPGRAAQAGHTDPDPAKDLAVPTHAPAAPAGTQQVAQQVAEYS